MLRKQKWAVVGGLILLVICMVIPGAAVMASGSTAVSGTVPLNIYNVQVTNITTTSATISWNTNNASGSSVSSVVSYGITIGYGSSVNNTSSGLHSVNLSSLSAGTEYYYQIQSTISGIPPATYSNNFNTAGIPFHHLPQPT
jgi:hypothetical protein